MITLTFLIVLSGLIASAISDLHHAEAAGLDLRSAA